MDIKFRYLPDSPPVFNTDRKVRAARWAAAKADYLAGGSAAEVCERHGLKLSTFRLHAKQGGWRRADQPAPFIAPDPAPAAQNDPLVIPDAPTGASRDGTPPAPPPPLTAAQMADKAWAHVQSAIAAGRQIEARGWLRIHKDLQPFVRAEEAAESLARMDREDAERRSRGEPEPEVNMTGPLPTKALDTLAAEMKALTRMAQAAEPGDKTGLQLDCFSRSESNDAGPSTPSSSSTGGSRHTDRAQPGSEPPASLDFPVRPGNDGGSGDNDVAPPLHCFSRSGPTPPDRARDGRLVIPEAESGDGTTILRSPRRRPGSRS